MAMRAHAIGNLVKDPELKQVGEKGTDLVNFSIAVNEYRSRLVDGERVSESETSFFDCEAWDSGARTLANRVKKGDKLAIEGKFRQHRWKTDEGQNRSRYIFRVESFEFLSPKRDVAETKPAPAAESSPVEGEPAGDENPPF